jgi:hypothetical protein
MAEEHQCLASFDRIGTPKNSSLRGGVGPTFVRFGPNCCLVGAATLSRAGATEGHSSQQGVQTSPNLKKTTTTW